MKLSGNFLVILVTVASAWAPVVAHARRSGPTIGASCFAGMLGSPRIAARAAIARHDVRLYAYRQNGTPSVVVVPGVKACGGPAARTPLGRDPRLVRDVGAGFAPADIASNGSNKGASVSACGAKRLRYAMAFNLELMRRAPSDVAQICRGIGIPSVLR
jgi:hypothetical protein